MSARNNSRQRYRQTPVYEFKGYRIRVYRVKNRFTAQFRGIHNSRERFEKATELDAVEAAKTRIRKLMDGDVQQLLLEEKVASDLLMPFGISMIEAARIVVKATTRLTPYGKGIGDAVDYFIERHKCTPITAGELVTEFIALKENKTGDKNVKDLKSKFRRFRKQYGDRLMTSLMSDELTVYLNAIPGSKRNQRNHHSALASLFKYGKTTGRLPKNFPTEMDGIERPKAEEPQINIFTPSELIALIRAGLAIRSRALAALLIQVFTGIRSEELCQTDPKKDRVRWGDVLLDDYPEINLRKNVSKTNKQRLVPIPRALARWLKLLKRRDDEPIFVTNEFDEQYQKIAAKAGLTWKKNGPRKSFSTYHSALIGSPKETAKGAGNSAAMVERYYTKAVRRVVKLAKAWFSLGPEKFGAAVRAYVNATRPKRAAKPTRTEKTSPHRA
jgi:integrase